jgi:hypothetical protein
MVILSRSGAIQRGVWKGGIIRIYHESGTRSVHLDLVEGVVYSTMRSKSLSSVT